MHHIVLGLASTNQDITCFFLAKHPVREHHESNSSLRHFELGESGVADHALFVLREKLPKPRLCDRALVHHQILKSNSSML